MIVVDHNQSLLDIAVQHGGSVTEVMALAIANKVAITDVVRPSTELTIGEAEEPNMVKFLASNKYVPATLKKSEDTTSPNGIGAWVIELDFTVA